MSKIIFLCKNNYEKGASLIEILFSLMILSLTLLIAIQGCLQGLNLTYQSLLLSQTLLNNHVHDNQE